MIINKTPHPVHITKGGVVVKTFPSEGSIRLKTEVKIVGEIEGIPTTTTTFGDVEGLPECSEGTYYIVSQLVKSALPARTDLLVPSEIERDSNGVIIGCSALGM